MRILHHSCLAVLLLLAAGSAKAAYWVESIAGPPGSCRILRNGKSGELQLLMLLHDHDRIILAKECAVVLVGANNTRTRLTVANSPFDVSATEAAPTALQNVQEWVVGWYNRQSVQEVAPVSMVVRGEAISVLPVLIEPTSPERNKLLAGTPSLQIKWTGGKAPYSLELTDALGHVVAAAKPVGGDEAADGIHTATLKLPDLQLGDHQIRVQDAQSADSIRVTVVPSSEEPDLAALRSVGDVPDTIRQSYRVITLASQREWRFQALQIAAANHLDAIAQRLIMGDFPETPANAPKASH